MRVRTTRRNASLARRGRTALAWALAGYFVLQWGFSIAGDRLEPALRDPEYGRKLALLQARVAEAPERPLTLILGSSRSGVGLLPEEFAADDATSLRPLVFNFAITGAGPVRELLTLRRLLAAGIRPRQVLVEIHPLLLHGGLGFGELASLDASRLDWSDVQWLSRFVERPGKLQSDWCLTRLAPCLHRRFCWLHFFAPNWLAPENPLFIWNRLDAKGGLALELPAGDEQQFERRVADSIREYAPAFERFRVTEAPDRALRELLSLCRKEQIAAALYLMPEEHRFQAAYSPESRIEIDAYLQSLAAEFACPAFDAANGGQTLHLAAEDFADGHHLSARGARAFSSRFGEEVLALLEAQRVDRRRLPPATRETTEVARGPGQTSQLR